MGFGAFGKETRLHGGGFLQKLGGFVNRITSALKPVAGTIAGVVDHFAPGVGTAIKTGFDVVDGISGQLKGGGTMAIDPVRLAKFNAENKGVKRSAPRENLKVDSILNKRLSVPRRAQVYDSDDDNSEEVEDSSE
jgi:hypothetical protein